MKTKKKSEKLDYELLADCYAKIIDKKNDLLELRNVHLNAIEKLLDDTLEVNELFLIENQTLKNNFYIMVILSSILLIFLMLK